MAFLPAIVSVVGGIASGIGALEQGQAAAQADAYNAQVEHQNAVVALSQGEAEAQDEQRKTEQSLGRMQAAYGAAGIEIGGDALGVYQDSAAQAAYDIAKIHYNAQVRSTGYTNQAQLDESKESADSTAGVLNMFSAGINTGASILKAT